MAIQNAEDLFVTVLSNLRFREDRKQQWLQAMAQEAQDPDVKQVIGTRAFVQKEIVGNLDECFRQMGVQPMKPEPSQFKETWIEDFRKERDSIQAPGLKAIYTYHKLSELVDMHREAYVALTAMADASGHYSVGALLETCLADKAAFIERNRTILRTLAERAVAGRVRAAA